MTLVAIVLSWLGLVVHNFADLPGQTLLSPETAIPTAGYVVAVLLWWRFRRVMSWVLLGWGWLQLVGGGIISVLPLPFLPFDPEQTLYHYAFHVLYGALQVPLLIMLTRYLRGR
ncbi:hypothetical protein [Nonomuraea sediminis]|uniref:hypothetical protein n=1 Tax=Nonomuraea sediminis TaxID=2835864 RepID=UPI001BDD90EE|nr:hypothetical protein [Nonomuraea sediminis]